MACPIFRIHYMKIQDYIDHQKKVQATLLSFIDEEGSEAQYLELSQHITDPKLVNNKDELTQLIHLISNISDNHHRNPNFFTNIKRIILLLKNEIINNFTKREIYNFFKNNRRTLLIFVEEGIISSDFFYSTENLEYFFQNTKDDLFYKHQDKGVNDHYICELILNDSVEEFITYVTKNCISLNSTINHSIFETNHFLIDKTPSLIEYSAFYGSIQIFRYLLINKAELKPTLWLYAIHSNNAEMIHLLEEIKIQPEDESYNDCLIESIKCHHNEIAIYIKDYLLDLTKKKQEEQSIQKNELHSIIQYHNYQFFPDNIENDLKSIFYLIQYNYDTLVNDLIENHNKFFIDINNYEIDFKKSNPFYYSFIVHKKDDDNDKKQYLIKEFKDDSYINEITRLIFLNYPSILNIKGISPFIFDNEKPIILSNYYENKLIYYIKEKEKFKRNSNTNDYIIILGIAIALKYLNNSNIYHNYLNPESILLDDNLYPIVSNIEITPRMLTFPNPGDAYYFEISVPFMSPEFIEDEVCFSSSAVFSFSLLVFNIITAKKPFSDKKGRFEILHDIVHGYRPDTRLIDNQYIVEFLRHCWEMDPESRLPIDSILDYITDDEFLSYFDLFDNELVKKYLDIYGEEFAELKNKF